MITYETSIFINRPPQEVWPYISNPVKYSQWQSGADSAEWTSVGPPGVGSTTREVGKILGRKMEGTVQITAWDPPNVLGRKSVGGPIRFEITIKLEPKDEGTQLNAHVQGELGGFLKIAEGLAGKQIEKQTEADFEALKLLLEAGQV